MSEEQPEPPITVSVVNDENTLDALLLKAADAEIIGPRWAAELGMPANREEKRQWRKTRAKKRRA